MRQLVQVKDLVQFQRFVQLCAGRVGQLLNLEGLGNDVGISSNTVKEWISILEASFILVRLQPYYENFGKRIVKAPKIYFTDVGLATYLLKIENIEQLSRDPLRGNLFENLILIELMKGRLNKGLDPQLYFFRDSHGHEVDFIFRSGNRLIPIEVKSAKTYNSDFIKNLLFFQKLATDRCPEGYIIYAGDLEQRIHEFKLIHYSNIAQIV